MSRVTVRNIFTLAVVSMVTAATALAQSAVEPSAKAMPASSAWEAARAARSERAELLVVTFDQPRRRQSCWVVYFTSEQLLCKRFGGRLQSFFPEQIAALILPGDADALPLRFTIPLFSAYAGAAIFGTVVLAATCPGCAVAAGIGTLSYFGIGGLFIFGNHPPDRLLYLAPGQQLTGKLRSLKFADGLPAPSKR